MSLRSLCPGGRGFPAPFTIDAAFRALATLSRVSGLPNSSSSANVALTALGPFFLTALTTFLTFDFPMPCPDVSWAKLYEPPACERNALLEKTSADALMRGILFCVCYIACRKKSSIDLLSFGSQSVPYSFRRRISFRLRHDYQRFSVGRKFVLCQNLRNLIWAQSI